MRAAPKAVKPRAWGDLVGLFPGSREELAAQLGVSRQALWNMLALRHTRCPSELLRRFARVLRTFDGTPTPRLSDVLRLWREAKARQAGEAAATTGGGS